jgi:hypothetical protein
MNDGNMPANDEAVGRSRGGKARAEALSPEERSEAARRAALVRWRTDDRVVVPRATHMGVLRVGDAEIPCAVLEDGRRLLTQGGFLRAIGRNRKPKAGHGGTGVDVMLPFLTAKNLKPFIGGNFRVSTTPVIFQPIEGGRALGYSAELLPVVCRVFVEAYRARALTKGQEHIAEKCQILLDGLATVGIIALVDEATGYQAERDRNELEKILAAYINQELLPWTRRFPDPYYREMFRLLGWDYSPPQVKRPKLVSKFTDEWIYKQLPPGVRDKLREKNPPNEKGNRRFRHHQLLTEDIGNPHLQSQITAITTLMRASRSLAEFRRLFRNAFPKPNTQLALPGLPEPEQKD